MNHDFALGAAVQLIKDIRRMAQSGNITNDPCTCINIKYACDDWLGTYGTLNDSTARNEWELGGDGDG